MAEVSKEELESKIAIILKDADLAKTSTKKVRQQLEKQLGVELVHMKETIDNIVMDLVDKMNSDDDEEEEEEEEEVKVKKEKDVKELTGKQAYRSPDSSGGSIGMQAVSKFKRRVNRRVINQMSSKNKQLSMKKRSKVTQNRAAAKLGKSEVIEVKKEEDDDKKSKRRLPKRNNDSDEDEELPRKRTRKAKVEIKKKPRKSGGGGKSSGYTRAYRLSPELAELMGAEEMPRHEVVRKIWALIKEHNLYDPNNKHFAVCDAALYKVFGVKRFRAFGMMKYLKNHFID